MFLREGHVEHSIPQLRKFIQQNPLGILTTAIESDDHPFIQSSHIPWVIDIPDPEDEKALPTLRGHIARKNPQSKVFTAEALRSEEPVSKPHTIKRDVMVLFNGPVHHYVTPKFYTKTKPESGKVVPTWNYSAVEAHGTATVYLDHKSPSTTAFLSKQIRDLSHEAETRIMGYSKPWAVEDAPEKYIELLAANIVGVEIEVKRLGGKFKMSQEIGREDVEGVVEGFAGLGTEEGKRMAEIVRERDGLRA
ncbi:hypothetical protein M409DRAFT_25116 [Zasmidium cellare ATCC 36951]|uniref:Transcriptional regulator n=1 Tax=Zasmidium cellare ATCC 36951 TaxID=1080233 RepID=A0A6A6CDC0_ZASCE|nr:uncharacterized protein M409DRAFT_25116 [Zasmidium cellare ATCC 36951]KAF2164723.1 hypothetical protein M409DRAFT_25116 [Zasmidium cellare ATCC 36951]